MPKDFIPPYNEEAERSVLGSVLIDNNSWREIYSLLNIEDFYLNTSRIIFEHMFKLFGEGVAVDPVTLGHSLRKTGDFGTKISAQYISDLLSSVATTANISHYAGIITETRGLRDILYKSKELSSLANKGEEHDLIYSKIDEIVTSSLLLKKSRMPQSLLSIGDKVLENYHLAADGYRGIKLPWKSLDDMTAGIWPKTVTMFVARPGVGKSGICIICSRYAWLAGKRVLIVSAEMDKTEMAERFFVTHAGIPAQNLIKGELSTQQEMALIKVVNDIRMLDGLYIMDSSDDLSPKGIDAAILACRPDLVAFDAIYRIKVPGVRQERATAAIEWMHTNCKERGYACIGFGQMNRGAELSEKKGGGARLGTIAMTDDIAQDAQNIFALEQSHDDKDDGILYIKPLKIRRGKFSKKSIRIHWDFNTMNFEEISEEEYEDNNTSVGRIPF